MKNIKLGFWDFDGTMFSSPLPDPGKLLWTQYHEKPYPHIGWWSKPESLDLDVFAIQPREIAYNAYLKYKNDPNAINYILTSRMPKLKPQLKAILDKHDIIMHDILCANGRLTKGERIMEILDMHNSDRAVICEINVWDDRNKEIVTIEPYREYLNKLDIALNITKIESDATD